MSSARTVVYIIIHYSGYGLVLLGRATRNNKIITQIHNRPTCIIIIVVVTYRGPWKFLGGKRVNGFFLNNYYNYYRVAPPPTHPPPQLKRSLYFETIRTNQFEIIIIVTRRFLTRFIIILFLSVRHNFHVVFFFPTFSFSLFTAGYTLSRKPLRRNPYNTNDRFTSVNNSSIPANLAPPGRFSS